MDQQEEEDRLLACTNKEMQAAARNDRRSPRSVSESTSSHQPKMNCDVKHNPSLPTKGKGRKRERMDHNSDSCKRERLMKIPNSDHKRGHLVNPDEVTNIVDKDGGILNLSSVDKLVHLMQQDCNAGDKKACEATSWRIMLVRVVALTEKEECLNRFVQLGGLPMLNDWLQEAHKGKDGGSPREGDRGVEELLMSLLQALDKLPVDLDALKKCIVGKSVNNLRSHKNPEIQKKARKLVDTWKKRVDAEMKLSESVQCAVPMDPSGNLAESSEIPSRSLSAMKGVTNDSVIDDSVAKYVYDNKSHVLTASVKDLCLKGHSYGSAEVPFKEEKNSNSSQSQNNSLSWSSGPLNGASSSLKEDAKLPSVSAGGKVHESAASGKGDSSGSLAAQKESASKSLLWGRMTAHEKMAYFGTAEKGSTENVRTENLNNQRLIVRLPNPGRGSSCNANEGSIAETTAFNRGSSPSFSEGHEGEIKMLNRFEIDITLVNDGKSEMDSGDEKARSSSVNPPDFTECRNVNFEHTSIDGKSSVPDEKKEASTINVDLHATGFGHSPVDGNEAGTGQLGDEERGKNDTDIDMKNYNGNSVNIGRAEESTQLSNMDDSGLNVHKIKTSNMNVMVVKETKGGQPGQESSGCSLVTESCAAAMEVDCLGVAEIVMSKQEDVIVEKILNKNMGINDQFQLQNNIDSHVENDGSSEKNFDGVGGVDTKTNTLSNIASIADASRAVEVTSQSHQKNALEGETEQYEKTSVQDASIVSSKSEYIPAQQADTLVKIESSCNELLPATACPNYSQVTVTERGEIRDTERTHEAIAGIKDYHVPLSGDAEKMKITLESMVDRSIDGCKVEGTITSIEQSCDSSDSMLPEKVLKTTTPEMLTTQGTDLRNVEPAVGSESSSRPLFDLNEGVVSDEPVPGDTTSLISSRSPVLLSGKFLAAPIAVVATSRGLLIPSLDSIPCKVELGWKGSAATSAFRPAEPRRTQESSCCYNGTSVKNARGEESKKQIHALDIDLNIADEKNLEDLNSDTLQGSGFHLDVQASLNFKMKAGGEVLTFANGARNYVGAADCLSVAARPELDLNLANESEEIPSPVASEILHDKTINSDGLYPAVRDFDLNAGPLLEDVIANEYAAENSTGKLPGLRINLEGNVASCFPSVQLLPTEATPPCTAPRAGLFYPVVSALPANSFLRTGSDLHTFNQELYARGTPTPAYSLSAKATFSSADFTLRPEFPLVSGTLAANMIPYIGSSSSTTFPSVPSEPIGAGAFVSPYRLPYMSGITKASTTEIYTAISKPSLDLNAGPELAEKDVRNEVVGTRQPHGFGHLSFFESGILGPGHANLKEPESAIDPFRPGLQHLTRQ